MPHSFYFLFFTRFTRFTRNLIRFKFIKQLSRSRSLVGLETKTSTKELNKEITRVGWKPPSKWTGLWNTKFSLSRFSRLYKSSLRSGAKGNFSLHHRLKTLHCPFEHKASVSLKCRCRSSDYNLTLLMKKAFIQLQQSGFFFPHWHQYSMQSGVSLNTPKRWGLELLQPLVEMWCACRALWSRHPFWTFGPGHAAHVFPNLDWMTLHWPKHVLGEIIQCQTGSCSETFWGPRGGKRSKAVMFSAKKSII